MSKAARTKEYIVEKTASIFNKSGYAGTSLTDLTEATGLTKGALYGNFKNKDEIAVAVFDYNLSLVRRIFFGTNDSNKSALDQLLMIPDLVKANFPLLAAHGGCPIVNTSVEADDNHPLLKKKVCQSIDAWSKHLEATIEKGVKEKTIRKAVNPGHFAKLMLTMLEGGLMLAKVTGDRSFINSAMDELKNMILSDLKN